MKDCLDKENYRAVSIISHMWKVFERLMHWQIDNYMNDKLSSLLTDFTKNHNTQHRLLTMVEKWRNNLVKGRLIGEKLFEKPQTKSSCK